MVSLQNWKNQWGRSMLAMCDWGYDDLDNDAEVSRDVTENLKRGRRGGSWSIDPRWAKI